MDLATLIGLVGAFVTVGTAIALGGAPVAGCGDQVAMPPATPEAGPWKLALTSSMLGAFTGWVLDGVSKRVFRGLQ